jgi:hypothetical protein
MDQAGKGGMDDMNMSDTTGVSDKLENLMNSDSLTKGLDMADSLLKNMDPEKMKEAMKTLEKLKELKKD